MIYKHKKVIPKLFNGMTFYVYLMASTKYNKTLYTSIVYCFNNRVFCIRIKLNINLCCHFI